MHHYARRRNLNMHASEPHLLYEHHIIHDKFFENDPNPRPRVYYNTHTHICIWWFSFDQHIDAEIIRVIYERVLILKILLTIAYFIAVETNPTSFRKVDTRKRAYIFSDIKKKIKNEKNIYFLHSSEFYRVRVVCLLGILTNTSGTRRKGRLN